MKCLACQGRGTYLYRRSHIKCSVCGGKGKVAEPVAHHRTGHESARDNHEREEQLRERQAGRNFNPFKGLFDECD